MNVVSYRTTCSSRTCIYNFSASTLLVSVDISSIAMTITPTWTPWQTLPGNSKTSTQICWWWVGCRWWTTSPSRLVRDKPPADKVVRFEKSKRMWIQELYLLKQSYYSPLCLKAEHDLRPISTLNATKRNVLEWGTLCSTDYLFLSVLIIWLLSGFLLFHSLFFSFSRWAGRSLLPPVGPPVLLVSNDWSPLWDGQLCRREYNGRSTSLCHSPRKYDWTVTLMNTLIHIKRTRAIT